MLTKLIIRNFKRFENVEIELGNPVVFIGPNNYGKTSALQAITLWELGLRRWNEKRKEKISPEKLLEGSIPEQRPGVAINRLDLLALPIPSANLLWRNLHVRDIHKENGKQKTQNIRVEIIVEGVTNETTWSCGLEFDYANAESIYCRPLRLDASKTPTRMKIPHEADDIRVAYLPPMSGLAANEARLQPGTINVRIGEGRTAEVLRNLCYTIYEEQILETTPLNKWDKICQNIQRLFGVALEYPIYNPERGEISMAYQDLSGEKLDLSSSGRGLQQTLLLLTYLAANPGKIILLDEPDAHLEILRQRQIYEVLANSAHELGCQIIIASHSEVILNEAADKDMVVSFVGKPHRIDDRGSQVLKSLKEIGFEQFYQAEQTGWVLYLEGSTDLAILKTFAEQLEHNEAKLALERPFVYYVYNQPMEARKHFHGLREAKSDLVGFALFDQLSRKLPESSPGLQEYMWERREVENYFCSPETLLAYVDSLIQDTSPGPLFTLVQRPRYRAMMQECIEDWVPRPVLHDLNNRWWRTTKVTDDFLDLVFEAFFKKLNLPNLMRKTDYHRLAKFLPKEEFDPEIITVLDMLLMVKKQAKPLA